MRIKNMNLLFYLNKKSYYLVNLYQNFLILTQNLEDIIRTSFFKQKQLCYVECIEYQKHC